MRAGMREERGIFPGDMVIAEHFVLWGSALGNVTVVAGGKFYARGAIHGDLVAEPGARVHLYGTVSGSVTAHAETKVIISGTVGRDAVNLGGRLYVDKLGRVMGRVITKDGKTKVEPKPA